MKSYFASKKATAAGTLIICVISIIFTFSSIYSIRNMESAASRIYEHPYTAVSYTHLLCGKPSMITTLRLTRVMMN